MNSTAHRPLGSTNAMKPRASRCVCSFAVLARRQALVLCACSLWLTRCALAACAGWLEDREIACLGGRCSLHMDAYAHVQTMQTAHVEVLRAD